MHNKLMQKMSLKNILHIDKKIWIGNSGTMPIGIILVFAMPLVEAGLIQFMEYNNHNAIRMISPHKLNWAQARWHWFHAK